MGPQGQDQGLPSNVDPSLIPVPCAIMRGGTSKAIFIDKQALPAEDELRDEVILSLFGSPHPRQIDGLGGADPLTSKLAIIDDAENEEYDVEYTFGQVSLSEPRIDYSATCGNISSAVGHYALEEGLVEPEEPRTTVTIFNTNNNHIITNDIPVGNGAPKSIGEFRISGVNGTGARVRVGFRPPWPEPTDSIFPQGRRDKINWNGEDIPYTLVDAVGAPQLFLRGSDFGCDVTEMPQEIDSDLGLIEELIELRRDIAVRSGIVSDEEEAEHSILPGPILIEKPSNYHSFEGGNIEASDISIMARKISGAYPSDSYCHKAFAGTAAICLGVASQFDDTLVDQFVSREFLINEDRKKVVIGHPSGTMESMIDNNATGEIQEVSINRTARRLMEGTGYAHPAHS